MRYLLAIVEQLDRAAVELRLDHPINHRLALILIDNAVELIIHRYATDQVRQDRYFGRYSQRKLTAAQRQAATGQVFEKKLKVIEFLGAISAEERRFAATCHGYRNQLYHVGLAHEEIIQALAGAYYRFCADLFRRLRPSSIQSSSQTQLTERAAVLMQGGMWGFGYKELDRLADHFLEACPQVPGLKTTLVAAAENALNQISGALDFLVTNNSKATSPAAELRDAQWWFDFDTRLKELSPDDDGPSSAGQGLASQVRDEMAAGWKVRHATIPHRRWRQQIGSIMREPSDYAALAKYQTIRDTMTYLDAVLMDAADALSTEIERQIDIARGK